MAIIQLTEAENFPELFADHAMPPELDETLPSIIGLSPHPAEVSYTYVLQAVEEIEHPALCMMTHNDDNYFEFNNDKKVEDDDA